MQVQTPDQVVVQPDQTCTTCQHDLIDQPIDHLISRQVFDLPAPGLIVTEYQIECKRCPRCQAMTQAPCCRISPKVSVIPPRLRVFPTNSVFVLENRGS